ncbi:MAG: HlyD family efflux transporter periplasmic adaptor subunit [Vicinamibacterales bacterium]
MRCVIRVRRRPSARRAHRDSAFCRRRATWLLLAFGLLAVASGAACQRAGRTAGAQATTAEAAAGKAPLRLSGTVEAVRSRTVAVPRLQGPLTPLVIIGLVPSGDRVEPGDALVEFDPQQQQRDALDRRAEVVTLEGDIAKKGGEQAAAEAKDRTALVAAEHDVERARLEVRKNDLIARIDAEKNSLALNQALAKFEQVQLTFALERRAAAADLRILEIRRERAERTRRYAEQNAQLMKVAAPFGGLVVIKRVYRNGSFVEIARGDEVRPGTPIVDIVDTTAMRVRGRLNQADAGFVHVGQPAVVKLDGFPDLSFKGSVTSVTPLAGPSQLSPSVRSFVVIVSIETSHPQLLPDLTASIDIIPEAAPAQVARVQP